MVKETEFYDILELSPSCSEIDIKKAYKKMSMKWHPDKNIDNKDEATKKFQKISEAYSVLSDKEKRDAYDNLGKEGMDQMNSGQDMDPNDIFSQFFGGGNPFGGGGPFGFNMNSNSREEEKENVSIQINVPLKSVYNEDTINVHYPQKNYCKKCDGTGNRKKISPKCKTCSGRGFVVKIMRMGPMITQQQQTCPDCKGSGKNPVSKEDECPDCKGVGYKTENKKIDLPLRNGLSDGNKIHLEGKGNIFKDYTSDLFIIIKVQDEEKFKRNGDDIVTFIELELYQSIFGFNKIITYLNNKLIHISHEGITKDDTFRKIKGLGMKNLNTGAKGSLVINFKVNYPDFKKKEFTPEDRKTLISILSKNNSKELKLEKEIKNHIKTNDPNSKLKFETYKMKDITKKTSDDNVEDGSPPQCVHQ